MTPEEIKKIAEAYVNDIANRMGIPKDYVSAETRKGLKSDCEPILQWLSARYYLVEKGKVEQTYTQNNYFAEHPSNPSDSYYQGVIDALNMLFGTDIRKEEDV